MSWCAARGSWSGFTHCSSVEAYVCDVGVSRRVALEVIGAVLTHSSPSSTLIYTHLTAEDLRRVLAERGVLDRVADLLV